MKSLSVTSIHDFLQRQALLEGQRHPHIEDLRLSLSSAPIPDFVSASGFDRKQRLFSASGIDIGQAVAQLSKRIELAHI